MVGRTRGQVNERNGTAILVSFALHSHLTLEHAEQQGEVAEREDHPEDPPGQPDGQAALTSGGVVDSQVERGITARRQYHGVERERRAHEHAHDVQGRADKGDFVLALTDRIDHEGKRTVYDCGDEESDDVLLVIVEHRGTDVNGRDQSGDRQEYLQRPGPERHGPGTTVQVAFSFHSDVDRKSVV